MTEKRNWLKKRNDLFTGLLLTGSLILMAGAFGPSVQVVQADAYVEPGDVFPVSVTMSEPMALGDVYLPEGIYGSVVWVNPDIVPYEGVSYYEVQLIPGDWVDITEVDGYDPSRGGVFQTIEVDVAASAKGADAISFTYSRDELQDPDLSDPDDFVIMDDDGLVSPDLSDPAGFILPDSQGLVAPDLSLPEDFILTGQQSKLASPDLSDPDGFVLTNMNDAAGPAPVEKLPEGFSDNLNPAVPLVAPEIIDPHVEYGLDFGEGGVATFSQMVASGTVSSKGVTVTGNEIPGSVSIEVSDGSVNYFVISEGADYFASYDIMLWDDENGMEYILPEGETAWVSIQVPEGYQYQVEHIRGDGTVEILPATLNGNILSFSTSSFSSFGIAGSYSLTDQADEDEVVEEAADTDSVAAPAQDTSASTPVSMGSSLAGSTSLNSGTSVSGNNTVYTDAIPGAAYTTSTQSGGSTGQTKPPVQTGDNTVILPFILLIVAAAILIVLLIMLKRKRR